MILLLSVIVLCNVSEISLGAPLSEDSLVLKSEDSLVLKSRDSDVSDVYLKSDLSFGVVFSSSFSSSRSLFLR